MTNRPSTSAHSNATGDAATSSRPQVITTCAELTALRATLDGDIGFVPTMGALHQGHARLIQTARDNHPVVIVSIFANPLQFADLGDCDDYRNYPRDLDADVALLQQLDVDYVFAPSADEMYPHGTPDIWVRTGRMGEILEGASRPGHFDGVATVVGKLLHLVRPHRAYFGEKDAQQVAVIRRMVEDLNFPVEIATVPIVRSAAGLAESSRNLRLSDTGRNHALALSRTLQQAAEQYPVLDLAALRENLAQSPGITLDYLLVARAADLSEVTEFPLDTTQDYLVLTAAWVEGIRLIDALPLPAT